MVGEEEEEEGAVWCGPGTRGAKLPVKESGEVERGQRLRASDGEEGRGQRLNTREVEFRSQQAENRGEDMDDQGLRT